MMAVVTTGNGGYDKLDYRAVPMPVAGPNEVVLRVLAAGVNNTDINTRLGWYSSSVTADTDAASETQEAKADEKADGGWNGATPFPLIQGTDCCGLVAQLGEGVSNELLGKRVLVRACMRPNGGDVSDTIWMASNFDGAFAQYVKVPASEVFAVSCDWTDEELATIPCSYATSENMLHRAGVGAGDVVLVTGASGGVGSATVQLAKRRGASVVGITSSGKMDQLQALGADVLIERNEDLLARLGESSVNVVVDNVAGPNFGQMLKVLKPGGALCVVRRNRGACGELGYARHVSQRYHLDRLHRVGCARVCEFGVLHRKQRNPPARGLGLPARENRAGAARVHGQNPLWQFRTGPLAS